MAAPSWAPTVAQVASVMHARTRTPNGALAGTFNDETEISEAQAAALIEDAANDLVAQLGDIPTELEVAAASALKYCAAALIEMSFFANQVGDDPNIFKALKDECKDRRATLAEALKDYNVDTETGSINAASLPANGFPGVVGTTLTEEW